MAKTTYTITPSSTTTITCATSSTLPSYHIPSALNTSLSSLTLSSLTTPTSSLPRYRTVFTLQRLPFLGYALTSSHTRAQIHVSSGSKHKSAVFLHGQSSAAMKVRKDKIVDGETGEELARMFVYKTVGGERVRALEMEGEGEERRRRDLLVAVWVS
ncbi:hypothetical protein BDD12DRAFT_984012 [Trichophaea hybrida]|nr:hypothetical protein BDD12DRAFT_984012 [Trichophaea hybrida]